MANPLTRGAISSISRGDTLVGEWTVQILSIKKITGNNASDRYRLVISDGDYFQPSAMLATQLNPMVDQNEITKFSIVRLKQIAVNNVQNRTIVIILELEVVNRDYDSKIGDPKSVDSADSAPVPAPAPAPAVTSHQAAPVSHAPAQQAPYNGGYVPQLHPNVSRSNDIPIVPIASLNPYLNRWTIRARVTNKARRDYQSQKQTGGKLFNVTLIDESGEIKATGFNDVVDQLYDNMVEGQVYYISKCQIKAANKAFNNLKHDYEMYLNKDTQVQPCSEHVEIPKVIFQFVKLNEMSYHLNKLVDVVAVIKEVREPNAFTSKKTGANMTKREVIIVDDTQSQITLTLWGDQALKFSEPVGTVVCAKGLKVSQFQDQISLGCLGSSILMYNESDRPEVTQLAAWFDENSTANFTSVAGTGDGQSTTTTFTTTPTKLLSQIKDENLGMKDDADYFQTRAFVTMVKKESSLYKACSKCNKKISDMNYCEKCSTTVSDVNWRMILSLSVSDHSGQVWLQAFNEAAEFILGCNAKELGELKESADKNGDTLAQQQYDQKFADGNFKLLDFKLRAKAEDYNNERRVRCGVMKVEQLDFSKASIGLLKQIQELEAA